MADSSTCMDEPFSLSVHEGSIKGGDRLTVNTSSPLPDGELSLILKGGHRTHKVPAERISSTCLYATLPPHDSAEAVDLSICLSKNNTNHQILFKTQFAYVEDEKKFMAELLLQSVTECGVPLQYSLLPPLPTPEALREYDQALADSMQAITLPPKWSLVGSNPRNCTQKETLLHFAARQGLNSLSQHLLSLPGASEAVLLPNEQGQLPIDIAREQGNEGLAQLLTMYMNQVHSNGVSVESVFSSPQTVGKEESGQSQAKQDLEKFKEINCEWKNQVKRYKALSYGCLPLHLPGSTSGGSPEIPSFNDTHRPSTPPPSQPHNRVHHIPLKKRRSSIAIMDSVSSRGNLQFHPGTPIDTVIINMRDSSLAEMERQRKTSWSRVVGSCDYRSVGTGLNELDRICAEETIHEKLVEVKTEVAELEYSKQDPAQSRQHLRLSQSHLGLMYRLSSSCPTLADDDDESEALSPFLSTTTSPGRMSATGSISEEDTRTDLASPSSQTSTPERTRWQRANSSGVWSDKADIPQVVTTEYHENSTSHSNSMSRQSASESELSINKETSSFVHLSTGSNGMRTYSTSALTDTDCQMIANDHSSIEEDRKEMSSLFSVEESIVEHRQLTQMVSASPVSSEQTEVNTDDDYILISSNGLDTTPDREIDISSSATLTTSDSITPVDTPKAVMYTQTRVPTPVQNTVRFKTHRRSLSSSEVEKMSSMSFSQEVTEPSSSSSQGWHSPLPVIDMIEEGDTLTPHTTSVDFDERSRASSLLTNDTTSMHESDTSEEDPGYRSPKEVTSTVSLDQQLSCDSSTLVDVYPGHGQGSEETDFVAESSVVVRERTKRLGIRASKLKRYSADYIISNVDDYLNEDDSELGSTNSTMVAKRRTNSTNVHVSSTVPEDTEEHTLNLKTPKSDKPKKTFLEAKCEDNVFTYSSDVSPSDVEVSLLLSDESLQNSHSSLFYKTTGSPKTIKRRRDKSPLLPRRKTVSNPTQQESPSRRRAGGLTKEDVGPTISALKDLVKEQPLNNDPGDESELSFNLTSSLERTGSNASESSYTREHRTPIATPPPDGEEDCSSLDFLPGSPMLKQKSAMPSPLTIRQTRSPINTMNSSTTVEERDRSSSSPYPIPLGVEVEDQIVVEDIETSETLSGVSVSDNLPPSGLNRKSLFQTVKSMDDGSALSTRTQDDVCPIKLTNSHEERAVPKEELREKERDTQNTISKFRHFSEVFRISKSNRKLGKEHGKSSSEAEQIIDSPPSTIKPSRPKSARKHKYEEVVFAGNELKYVTADEYTRQLPARSSSSEEFGIQRSASMQVGVNHVGTSTKHHNRSTSLQAQDLPNERPHLRKQQSEDILGPSARKSEFGSLSPLEEDPSGSMYDITGPSSHLLPTSPQVGPPSGESENEEQSHDEYQLVRSLSVSHPVLEIQDEPSWDKTIDRKLYKKLNKAERERQAILHELIRTEKNHFRALHVLKLIFRQQIMKVVSEETLIQLFPELDNLIEISDGFVKRLESKKSANSDDIMIEDLSDVLLEQFTGVCYSQMLHSFGIFCSGQLNATEIFKEHMKKKPFSRLMKQLHALKECQRLTLPDYYLQVTQALSRLLTLLKRLAKKSESLKLDHAPRVRESLENLEGLMLAVDQTVLDNKNRMEVEAIQSRLEVSVPKSSKIKNRQEIKSLSLTAQDRKLRKRGMALWIGHAREVSVHLILVTDLVVLLTERDQKYHLASLQDLKPPVIRLYDLHVRLNVSVKTGVQLLLLEKGSSPEMFRLEFVSKKQAKEWEATLNSAIDECKEKGLKCEFFGAEKVVSGDEEKKSEDKGDSDLDEATHSLTSPALKSMQRARESLALATKLLSSSWSSTTTADSTRQHGVAIPAGGGAITRHDSPKNRNRTMGSQQQARPKTAFFSEDEITNGSSATLAVDHVITAPIASSRLVKSSKSEKKRKLDRSATFKGKDKEKDKEKYLSVSHSGESDSHYRVPEAQYVSCITSLKDSLQEMMNQNEGKDNEISKLRNEIETLQEALQGCERQPKTPSPPVVQRLSPRSSPMQLRPHSIHIDLSEPTCNQETLSNGEMRGGNSQSELLVDTNGAVKDHHH